MHIQIHVKITYEEKCLRKNAWTNFWNKIMAEKAGVKKQNCKKGFEKNEHPCSIKGVLLVLDHTALPVHI